MKRFRYLVVVLLLAALLAASIPAMAASKALTISFTGSVTLSPWESADVLKTTVNSTQSGVISYTLTDTANKTVVYSNAVYGAYEGQEITWSVPYDDTGLSSGKPVKRMKASFTMDDKTYTYNVYYNYAKKDGNPQITVEKATWYPNNTACSFGPQFRETRPGLTDKWYMFTPINLTRQGRQEFDYVASNLYVIGKVYVDVMGDSVTVTYENLDAEKGGNTETLSEYFTIFPDLKSVTNVEPETMEDLGFRFGQSISIQNDLAGDTNVLLFVRNRVTYCDYVTNSRKLTRFWINHPDRVAVRNAMLAMMDP